MAAIKAAQVKGCIPVRPNFFVRVCLCALEVRVPIAEVRWFDPRNFFREYSLEICIWAFRANVLLCESVSSAVLSIRSVLLRRRYSLVGINASWFGL